MRNYKTGGARNFGYGRSARYAIRNVLKDHYGEGRYATRYTLINRLCQFDKYLGTVGIRDLRDVTMSVCLAYANHLKDRVGADSMSTATAINYLSAVNILFRAIRGDDHYTLSPREHIGARSYVRKSVPSGMDLERVQQASSALELRGEERLVALLQLCRVLGLRFSEAALLDIRRAYRELLRTGYLTIKRGTKGGRVRTFQLESDEVLEILERLLPVVGNDRCLVPNEQTAIQFSRRCHHVWRRRAEVWDLNPEFRDLRASFACDLYTRQSRAPAPVVTNGRTINRAIDRRARKVIATALGHGREAIAASYVGTSRGKNNESS